MQTPRSAQHWPQSSVSDVCCSAAASWWPTPADGLPGYRQTPSLAVFPGTRDELIAVVRALAAADVPFVPRGAGTGLSGGALADGTVLLGLNRLTHSRHRRRESHRHGGAGRGERSLPKAAAAHGLHYAPDPSSQTACTIGGNVAENAGGPHCLKYGVTLNHVVGLDGRPARRRDRAARQPERRATGYDLLGAFVGIGRDASASRSTSPCACSPNPAGGAHPARRLHCRVDAAATAVSRDHRAPASSRRRWR